MSIFLKNLLECSLIMGMLTLLLTALTPLLGRKYSAKGLYGAWMVLMAGFFILWRPHITQPAVTLSIPVTQSVLTEAVHAPNIGGADYAQTAAQGMANTSGAAAQAAPAMSLGQILLIVWVAGIVISLCVQITKHIRFRRMVKRWGKPVTDEGALFVLEKVKMNMGIEREVALKVCAPADSPMLIGLFKPVILLPDLDLTDEELSLVIRHELTHMQRGDIAIKALMMLVTALHWFNPAVYMASRTMAFYQEASCDAAVTKNASSEERKFYSETIISIIRRQSRVKTALSTSFYGGKNGMKRRILSIMEGRSKKLGTVLVCLSLVLVLGAGLAFAVSYAPEDMSAANLKGKVMYIHCPDGSAGAPILSGPTANDLNIPAAVGYPGTQVTVLETIESSSVKAWNSKEGEANWAYISIAGSGENTAITGYIPIYYLSLTKLDKPYEAYITGDEPTGHVNLYQKNDESSKVIDAVRIGEKVTLLERVHKWYHIRIGSLYGFVPIANISADEDTALLLEKALPDRFDTQSWQGTGQERIFNELVERKSSENGGLPFEDWSIEDKAWYGQIEETYLGKHDRYYMLPSEGDMSKEQAISKGWKAFVEMTGLTELVMDDFLFSLGFYTIPNLDPNQKYWDVSIRSANNARFTVTLRSPGGEYTQYSDEAVEYYRGLFSSAEKWDEKSKAHETWLIEKGPRENWSYEDRAEFSKQFGDGLIVVPNVEAITQEKAEALAREAIYQKYDVKKETLDGWRAFADYCKYVPGTDYFYSYIPSGVEGDKVREYWLVTFHDKEENRRAEVEIDAFTGDVIEIVDQRESNG